MHPQPPERFHAFVSYTTREEEVQIVKPFVDNFLQTHLRPIIEQTIGEPPIFYDGYTLFNPNRSRFSDSELASAIRFAIEESEVLLAFLSPSYAGSHWCVFELTSMGCKEFRPWFDLCRNPPILELRDNRPEDRRPNWWDCIYYRLLMKKWRWSNRAWKPGGAIVPILLNDSGCLPPEMEEIRTTQIFDWRVCWRALAAQLEVTSRMRKYGGVQSLLEAKAQALAASCQKPMTETAVAIADLLRLRRLQYSSQVTHA